MPLLEELVDIFAGIEKQKLCVVDGERYVVFIDVKIVVAMMFLHKFTEHGRWVLCYDHILLHLL